jgi:hypothetical protein
MRRTLAVVSSRILSMAGRCLLTLAERIMRERSWRGCSDIGLVTCGESEDSHDFVGCFALSLELGDVGPCVRGYGGVSYVRDEGKGAVGSR